MSRCTLRAHRKCRARRGTCHHFHAFCRSDNRHCFQCTLLKHRKGLVAVDTTSRPARIDQTDRSKTTRCRPLPRRTVRRGRDTNALGLEGIESRFSRPTTQRTAEAARRDVAAIARCALDRRTDAQPVADEFADTARVATIVAHAAAILARRSSCALSTRPRSARPIAAKRRLRLSTSTHA